ncbi:MAG TPA: hypothetical protein VFA25_02260 [Actinomycetota bacterium]|jgi:hypothetical protein|nr:hypothetical protein [Actinomycetota bacterium]
MRGARARTLTFVAFAFAVVGAACAETGTGHGNFSLSPPPASDSLSPSPSPSGSASPGPASPLTAGVATVNVSGQLTVTVPLPQLVVPAVWGAPPAPMDLTWTETGPQSLRIAGTSFVSRASTNSDLTLSMTIGAANGALSFTSNAGECNITITPALPDNMGGVFSCSGLTDEDGNVTVDAQGVFSATA